MEEKKIYIKNMVCRRCIMTVSDIFVNNGVTPVSVNLGTVVVPGALAEETKRKIRHELEEYGFEVIDDKRMRVIEQIRVGVIEYVRHPEYQEKAKLSAYLQDVCHKEYSALSKLFTEMRGISIEKYYLAQRIELVKELLAYDEMTVSEIADKLLYSSVAHLSAQFKAQTGLSPTQFKEMKEHRLRPLDEI